MVAHNGEINTVKGNFNWMTAREGVMSSPVLGADLQKLYPISFAGQSDTATFDNCLELLTMAGYPHQPGRDDDDSRAVGAAHHDGRAPPRVLRIPRRDDGAVGRPGRDRVHRRPPDRRHAGPQRPAPVALHASPTTTWSSWRSESGVLPVPENKIVRKWRLQPGKMFLIDLEQGRIDRRRGTEGQPRQQQAVQAVDREPAHQARRRRRRRDRARRCTAMCACSTASRPSATPRKTSSS